MSRDPGIISTERHLTNLFVGGAMLFLILFELVFLIGRVISENSYENSRFLDESTRIYENLNRRWQEVPRGNRPRIELSFALINASGGVILSNSGAFIGGIDEIIGSGEIREMPENNIIWENGRLFRKISDKNSGITLLFFRNRSYVWDDIVRDVLRFILLDLIILLPLWFMSRSAVRKTLLPVEENLDTMAHFVHDAGHELKTPLAVVSGNLQLIRDFPEKKWDLVESSIATIHSLAGSIDGLITLANLQSLGKRESIPLMICIEWEYEHFKDAIREKHLTLSLDIPAQERIRCNEKHFRILMKNLIENAIKYNKKNGSITIEYKKNILSVNNTGKTIPEWEIPKIFDRFYRVEKNEKNGSGIGLAIVDRIVKMYGWKCRVESTEWEGTTFFLTLS